MLTFFCLPTPTTMLITTAVHNVITDKKRSFPKEAPSNLFIINNLIIFRNDYSSIAACAAAKRAIGTRNGEQET